MGVVLVGLDDVSLKLKMGLDEVLADHVQVVNLRVADHIHNQLHPLQA
jgi:hypothetical protein